MEKLVEKLEKTPIRMETNYILTLNFIQAVFEISKIFRIF